MKKSSTYVALVFMIVAATIGSVFLEGCGSSSGANTTTIKGATQ